MGRRFVLLLALALLAASGAAQPSDTLKLESSPPPAFAALPRTEAEFLARYGANDSSKALINYCFRRRKLGYVLLGVGTVSTLGGAYGYIENAGLNAVGQGLATITNTIIPGVKVEPKYIQLNPVVHVFFFGGLVSTFVGANTLTRYSRNRLRRELGNPSLVSPNRWAHILRKRNNELPSTLPSIDEEQAALRQQQEYWRKRGRTPPTPKQ